MVGCRSCAYIGLMIVGLGADTAQLQAASAVDEAAETEPSRIPERPYSLPACTFRSSAEVRDVQQSHKFSGLTRQEYGREETGRGHVVCFVRE